MTKERDFILPYVSAEDVTFFNMELYLHAVLAAIAFSIKHNLPITCKGTVKDSAFLEEDAIEYCCFWDYPEVLHRDIFRALFHKYGWEITEDSFYVPEELVDANAEFASYTKDEREGFLNFASESICAEVDAGDLWRLVKENLFALYEYCDCYGFTSGGATYVCLSHPKIKDLSTNEELRGLFFELQKKLMYGYEFEAQESITPMLITHTLTAYGGSSVYELGYLCIDMNSVAEILEKIDACIARQS